MSGARVVLPLVAGALLLLAAAAFGGGDAALDERVTAALVLLAVLMAIIGAVLAAPRRSTEPDAPAMAERSDAELVSSAARGHSDDAWAELRRRHRRAIAALLEYLLGDRDHAEEVADEVFATARGRLPDKPAETSFKQWIHSLALGAVTKPAVAPADDDGAATSVPRGPEAGALRSRPHYVSADTAPPQFAVARRLIVAPAFLVLYAAVCAAIVPALSTLMTGYAEVLSALSGVEAWKLLGKGGSLSFRPFLLALAVLLCAFAPGSPRERLRLLGFAAGVYLAAVVSVDVVLAVGEQLLVPPFSQVGGIAAGLTGLLAIISTIFLRYRLPVGIKVVPNRRRSRRFFVMLGVSGVVVASAVAALSLARTRYFDDWHLRFIGGLDSEVVLFLLGMVCVLAVWSALDRASKPHEGPWLSAAFLIPAFNEAHGIAETIRSIDVAASRYRAICDVYVVDNGSWDDTIAVARSALDACPHLQGHVLECQTPGKSHALNFGLRRIEQDVIVRIDADTSVEPSLMENVMPWFWDPSVGAVGGLPLPKHSVVRWLRPLRLIEVYYGVHFLRAAQSAADAVLVVPGLIAAYRRDVVDELGGFGEGFNGEDADITVRIGRLGYRVVTDPDVRVYTEVPESLAQFREQRQRWSRGLYHMARRNMSSIWMRQGARSLWNLPWSIFNASRRAMMIPVLVAALTVEILEPSVFSLREVSVVAGFLVGLQLIVISLLLIAHRRFAVLPYVPSYLLFRMLRAYIAFETVLTLRLKERRAEAGDPSPSPAFEPADLRPALSVFADDMLAPIPEKGLRRRAEAYVEGLLADGGGADDKRIESPWPWEPVRARLATRLADESPALGWILERVALGAPQAETAAVVLAADGAGSCPVNWRLPSSNGSSRRAPSPPEHGGDDGDLTGPVIEMLTELRSWGVVPPVICAGRRNGGGEELRRGLEAGSFRYVLEVSGSTQATAAVQTLLVSDRGNGSAPRSAPLSEIALATGLRKARTITWDEPDGPRTSRFLILGVVPADSAPRGTRRRESLIHFAICEWPQGAEHPTSYWLSNLPAGIGVQRLVELAKLRRGAGPDHAALERELALDQTGTWSPAAWDSHVTLVSLTWGFLLLRRGRDPGARGASPRRAFGRRRVRRREHAQVRS
jgi:cellulose synthase/poly-beta-1,6-N-acetylglucosamine synthase-like glycosyltransferase